MAYFTLSSINSLDKISRVCTLNAGSVPVSHKDTEGSGWELNDLTASSIWCIPEKKKEVLYLCVKREEQIKCP